MSQHAHYLTDPPPAAASGPRFRLALDLARDPALLIPPDIRIPPLAVAGRVTLLTLGPKGGKSTTAAGLIALGTRLGVRCGLLTLDEAKRDSLQRLYRFGAIPDLVALAEEFDPATLGAELASLGLQVLVVDHLGKLAEQSSEFGANSQGDPILWGRLLSHFTRMARESGLAVVLLDQARRADGKYSGSTAKAGAVDVLAEMKEKGAGLVCTPRGRIHLPPFRVDLNSDRVPVFRAYAADGSPTPRPGSSLAASHRALALALLKDVGPEGLKATAWQRLCAERGSLQKTAFYAARGALLQAGLIDCTGGVYLVRPMGELHLTQSKAGA